MDQQRECESGASLGGEHTATPLVMYRTRLECCFCIPCNKRRLRRLDERDLSKVLPLENPSQLFTLCRSVPRTTESSRVWMRVGDHMVDIATTRGRSV